MVDLSIEVIKTLSTLKKDDNYWSNVRKCMIETVCFPEDIMNNKIQESKIIQVDADFYKYFANLNNHITSSAKQKFFKVKLYKNQNDLSHIQKTMIENHYEKDKIRAVVKTLGSNSNAYSYKITTNLNELEAKDLTVTFNNDDGMVHHKFN